MKEINIEKLNDVEFESFCKDILEYKLEISARTFRKGRDKGIDGITLREDVKWIMQSKFCKNSSDSSIIRNLEIESGKVKKLKPDRYFLFVAKELTVSMCEKIIGMFSPYLKLEDLYDEIRIKDILNEKNAEYILDKWDKLWLPSAFFVDKFYKKVKNSKYEQKKKEAEKEANIFVETKIYKMANKVLKNKNVILIHGQPGAGKTVLARRLALKYIQEGYEFFFEKSSNINEIEDYIYDGRRKIIIIDDFLGQSSLELRGLSDNTLHDIIRYAKNNDNIKLILTTRTYIYNNAKQMLEKFAHTSERLEELLIEVSDYTESDKAKILYNHLYYNDLLWSIEYLDIVKGKYYNQIIYHKNFTPRNIEKICELIKEDRPNNVINMISGYLDNPGEIWEHEYKKISQSMYGGYEKILLDLICFLEYEVDEEELKEQFEKIIGKDYDEYIFYESLDDLSNAFVSSTYNRDNKKVYKLANPSMEDFLREKAKKCKGTIKKYIKSIDSIEGIYDFYRTFSGCVEIENLAKQRIQEIVEDNITLDYFEKRLIGFMFNKNLNDAQRKMIENLVDEAFEDYNSDNVTFILDILEMDVEDSYMYVYMLRKFKEYEIDRKESKYRLALHLNSTFDWNVYLGACNLVLKRKNSKYMMDIMGILIDCLIDCITVEAEELMGDHEDEIIERYKNGEELDKIVFEFVQWSLDDLENIWEVYTEDNVEYIFGIVRGNCDACLDEEELEEAINNQENDKDIEFTSDDKVDIDYLFGKNLGNDELLCEYFRNSLINEKSISMVELEINKWYIQFFLDDSTSLKLLTEFINEEIEIPQNANLFGERLVRYLLDEEFYNRYKEIIEEMAYQMLQMKDVQNIDRKVLDVLSDVGILVEDDGKIKFLNDFFVIYFGLNRIKSKFSFNEIIENSYEWLNGQAVIPIINMYSYTNLEQFNKEYLLPGLYYYSTYIRKSDKYSISKSLINKFKPTIYIHKYGDGADYISVTAHELEYLGMNIIDNLSNISYWKILKFLDNNYLSKKRDTYKIPFDKVVQNEKSVKEFDKILVWDYLEEVYYKIEEALEKLVDNINIDAYEIFDNKIFNKYLDNDNRENFDKYNNLET